MNTYHIEITDTFGDDANYSWKREYITKSKSINGAIKKLARHYGAGWLKDYDYDDSARFNLKGCAVCCFVMFLDDSVISSFNGVKVI